MRPPQDIGVDNVDLEKSEADSASANDDSVIESALFLLLQLSLFLFYILELYFISFHVCWTYLVQLARGVPY